MKRIFFSGIVHPQRATLSVSEVHTQYTGSDGTPITLAKIYISNNQITVEVETEEANIFTLRNLVKSEVEFLTGIVGFINGCGYDIEITKAIGEGINPPEIFGVDIPVLRERANHTRANEILNAIFPLCFEENGKFLKRCLVDLSFAIKRAEDTSFYCYRALESLRHSFGIDLEEKEQWKAMGKAINLSKESMDFLRTHARDARHGVPKAVTDQDRQNFYLYTWDAVEKYIDYRLSQKGISKTFSLIPIPELKPEA